MRPEFPVATVIPFPARRGMLPAPNEPKDLLDTVYNAGAMPVGAGDRPTKAAVARLHLFGFFVVEEVRENGAIRTLLPSETSRLDLNYPWRVSRRYSVGAAASLA